MKTEENQQYLTKQEVAKLLKVSICTVNNYSKKGYLQPLGIGRRVLFKKSDIENALTEL